MHTKKILATIVCAIIVVLITTQSINRLANIPHYLTVTVRVKMDAYPDGQPWGSIVDYSLNLSRNAIDVYDNVSLSKMFPTNMTGLSGNLIIEIVANGTGGPGVTWSHTIEPIHNQAGTYDGVVAHTIDVKGRTIFWIVLYANYSGTRHMLQRISEWIWL
jgi:hypothetical protein